MTINLQNMRVINICMFDFAVKDIGVHYPTDVVVGAAFVVCGAILFC